MACFVASALILSATPAFADEPVKSASPRTDATGPSPTARRWYGGQTLVVEGASLALIIAGAAIASGLDRHNGWAIDSTGQCISGCSSTWSSISDVFLYTGFAGYVLGPPIVHITHDHGGKAGASFGMRLFSGLLMGAGVAICQETVCHYLVPGAAAVIATSAVDAGIISYEDVPSAAPTMSLAPWYDARTRATGVGVAGSF